MPAAPADRVSSLIQKTHQINNTPSSQALMKSDSQQLMEDYKKVSVVGGGSRTSLKSDKSTKITGTQWWAIAILTFVNLINYMDRYTIAGVLGDVKTHYKIGDDQAGALQTIFVSSYMIVAPIFGYLGDRYSRRWLMVVGVSIWVVAVAAGSLMESFGWFMFFRAVVGVGEASYSTIAPTLISDMFVKEARSKVLAIFYFAIPVGSGLGYVVGQQMSEIFGSWQWALRGTPVLGVVAVVLIIFCLQDPPRGGVEGINHEEEAATSYSEDLRSLATNGSFIFSTLGFTCVTFCTGALSWWGPNFLQAAIRSSVEESAVPVEKVSFIFGLVTMLAGIFGVILGATSSTLLKRRWARADPVICGVGLATCSVIFAVALFHFAQRSVVASLVFIFFGMIAINLNWSIVADILLYVVAPNRRGTAEALQILLSHLFGDAGSPYLIGVVSEGLQGRLDRSSVCGHMADPETVVNLAANATRCQTAVEFYSMQYSMSITLLVVAVGAVFFFITAIFVVRDKAACDNFMSNSKNGGIVEERGMLTPRDMEDADFTDEDEPPTLIAAGGTGKARNNSSILKPRAYSPLEDNNSVRFNKDTDTLYTEVRPSATGGVTPPFARLLDSSADSSLNSSSHSSSNNLIAGSSKKTDAEVVKEIITSSDFSVKLKQSPGKNSDSA